MVIAGPCSFTLNDDPKTIKDCAIALKGLATHFRCKLWLGGTTPDKYQMGVEDLGLYVLEFINEKIMPAGTEIHIPEQADKCGKLNYIWIGARNSSNYSLLREIAKFPGDVIIKRAPGMTINEIIGIYDIMDKVHCKRPYIIDRGILTFDRQEDSRWSSDLKGAILIKQERPDIFEHMIIDVSHSTGKKEYIPDTYQAFKAIGIQHWMFEATLDGKSYTDQRQMLSVAELENILK